MFVITHIYIHVYVFVCICMYVCKYIFLFSSFNNVYSNIGYVMLGLLFWLLVWRRYITHYILQNLWVSISEYWAGLLYSFYDCAEFLHNFIKTLSHPGALHGRVKSCDVLIDSKIPKVPIGTKGLRVKCCGSIGSKSFYKNKVSDWQIVLDG